MSQSLRARRPDAGLPVSSRASAFVRRYFPDIGHREWNDWRWQVRNRIRRLEDLAGILTLSEDERTAVTRRTAGLPLAITPYYLSLLDPADPEQPLRRTVVPVGSEFEHQPGEDDDPLGEGQGVVPGLVHRYPDRVLFLVTGTCSTYCRYCTRSRLVGTATGEGSFSRSHWRQAIAYIREHREIRDCLLSGGDPLTIGDDALEWLLAELRSIPHLELIRIGTKVPMVLPQRITRPLVRMLRRYHPLWMSIHATHPDELTPESREALERLADAGIPLGSQTVLLKGVNDDVAVLRRLMHGLLLARVRPYYLYQCDPVSGSAHFRTAVDTGLTMIRGLRGHTSGYAVPQFVVDTRGGKVPLLPDAGYVRDGDELLLRTFREEWVRYPDPQGQD